MMTESRSKIRTGRIAIDMRALDLSKLARSWMTVRHAGVEFICAQMSDGHCAETLSIGPCVLECSARAKNYAFSLVVYVDIEEVERVIPLLKDAGVLITVRAARTTKECPLPMRVPLPVCTPGLSWTGKVRIVPTGKNDSVNERRLLGRAIQRTMLDPVSVPSCGELFSKES